MDKVRISEIAQELGMEAKDVLAKAKEVDLEVKAANSAVTTEEAGNLMDYMLTGKYKGPIKKKEEPKAKAQPTPVKKETPAKVEVEKAEAKG